MITNFEMVREFHMAFGHPAPDTLTEPDLKTIKLRLSLITEELSELFEAVVDKSSACGVDSSSCFKELQASIGSLIQDDITYDVVEAADALADIVYVTNGTAAVMGLPFDKINSEVHSSNMSKLGEDGRPIYDENAKVLKGPNYFKPAIRGILDAHANTNLGNL